MHFYKIWELFINNVGCGELVSAHETRLMLDSQTIFLSVSTFSNDRSVCIDFSRMCA